MLKWEVNINRSCIYLNFFNAIEFCFITNVHPPSYVYNMYAYCVYRYESTTNIIRSNRLILPNWRDFIITVTNFVIQNFNQNLISSLYLSFCFPTKPSCPLPLSFIHAGNVWQINGNFKWFSDYTLIIKFDGIIYLHVINFVI